MEDYFVRELFPSIGADRAAVSGFLSRHGLAYEADIEAAYGLFSLENRLVGCGCAAKDMLKCFAVEPFLRGQNALGRLLSALMQNRYAAGYYHLLVVTRAGHAPPFERCGFYTVARTEKLAMLENAPGGPERFARSLLNPEDGPAGAIIMNCNPFTNGHRALVEYAAGRCATLYLFVVEEDRSYFSTQVRLRLAREATADLPHVHVRLSGRYMISGATFPLYFLKRDEDASALQAGLDAALFAQKIAPLLGIRRRFEGREPFDPATRRYHEILAQTLPRYGIELVEIERMEQNGQAVSASRVRKLLKTQGVCQEALDLVPPATRRYLQTEFRGNQNESGRDL